MKTCTKCGLTKPLDQFYNQKDGKDGKHANCKACRDAYEKAKYDPVQNRYKQIKYFYGMTPEEYHSLLDSQEGKCACCGIDMVKIHVDHDHINRQNSWTSVLEL